MMRRLPRFALLLVALVAIAPVLAGCENFDPDSLDPFGLNKKDKLPGQRELLFPEGVPGVSQGIPQQYRAGNQPPGSEDLTFGGNESQQAGGTAAAPATQVQQSNLGKPVQVYQSTAKPKPKAKPRRVVKPKPAPKPTETASKPQGTQEPWPSSTQQQTTTQPQGTQAPWPAQQQQQTQSGWPASGEQKLAPWPSAPPSGTFSK
jgi:hypothetical protein